MAWGPGWLRFVQQGGGLDHAVGGAVKGTVGGAGHLAGGLAGEAAKDGGYFLQSWGHALGSVYGAVDPRAGAAVGGPVTAAGKGLSSTPPLLHAAGQVPGWAYAKGTAFWHAYGLKGVALLGGGLLAGAALVGGMLSRMLSPSGLGKLVTGRSGGGHGRGRHSRGGLLVINNRKGGGIPTMVVVFLLMTVLTGQLTASQLWSGTQAGPLGGIIPSSSSCPTTAAPTQLGGVVMAAWRARDLAHKVVTWSDVNLRANMQSISSTLGQAWRVFNGAGGVGAPTPAPPIRSGPTTGPGGTSPVSYTPPVAGPGVFGLDADQVHNAQIIIAVGQSLALPRAALLDAVTAAGTESSLHNLPGGDRDSAGLFQMRPSMGWGTLAQVTDPVYAATKFFSVLTKIPGWQALSPTEAAQAVERSGNPGAYAAWVSRAILLVDKFGGTQPSAAQQASRQLATQDIIDPTVALPGCTPLPTVPGGDGLGRTPIPGPIPTDTVALIEQLVRGLGFGDLTVTSTFRPGGSSYHAQHEAVDFSDGTDTAREMALDQAWAATYGASTAELIHAGTGTINIKDGRNVGDGLALYGAQTMSEHHNHVHIALTPESVARGAATVGGGGPTVFGASVLDPSLGLGYERMFVQSIASAPTSRPVAVTFKSCDPQAVQAFVAHAATGTRVDYFHEPEQEIEGGRMTAAEWAACESTVISAVQQTGRVGQVIPVANLMRWTLDPASGRQAMLAATLTPQVLDGLRATGGELGWDAYTDGGPTGPRRTADDLYGVAARWSAAQGLPYSIMEAGARQTTADSPDAFASWWAGVGTFLAATPPRAYLLWNPTDSDGGDFAVQRFPATVAAIRGFTGAGRSA